MRTWKFYFVQTRLTVVVDVLYLANSSLLGCTTAVIVFGCDATGAGNTGILNNPFWVAADILGSSGICKSYFISICEYVNMCIKYWKCSIVGPPLWLREIILMLKWFHQAEIQWVEFLNIQLIKQNSWK